MRVKIADQIATKKGALGLLFPFCHPQRWLCQGFYRIMVDAKISNLSWESAPDILTVREAAALLRVSTGAVYAAIKLGLLPAANFGKRQTRIAKHALREELVKKGEVLGLTVAFGHVPEAN